MIQVNKNFPLKEKKCIQRPFSVTYYINGHRLWCLHRYDFRIGQIIIDQENLAIRFFVLDDGA